MQWSNVIYVLFTCFQKSFSFSIWFQTNSLVDTSSLPSVWQLQCQCNLTLPHSFPPSHIFSLSFTSFSVTRWISVSFQTQTFSQWFCFGLAPAAVEVPNVSLSIILCKCKIKCETFTTSRIYSGLFTSSSSTLASCSCWAVDNTSVCVCVCVCVCLRFIITCGNNTGNTSRT